VPLLRSSAPPALFVTSCSVPCGLYVRQAGQPRPGDLVAACLPGEEAGLALARGYVAKSRRCPHGEAPVVKRLVAGPGARVAYEGQLVTVGGEPLPASSLRQLDRAGRPLPVSARYPYTVAQGSVLLLADHPDSYDGRYFGPVPEELVLGVYRPLWTSAKPLRAGEPLRAEEPLAADGR
jgi:conjugative transfer signal peptidase TraF